jgi:hypothetical protein
VITLRNNYHINSSSVFPNKMYFATWDDAGDIMVYKIMLSSEQQSHGSSSVTTQPLESLSLPKSLQKIELIALLSKPSTSRLTFAAISQDSNEIYFYQQNNSNLQRWARCADGSYFEDNQCYQCDTSCKTCMFSIFRCTSCESGQYLTENKQCKKCPDTINFCQTCSFSAGSLSCDKCLAGFVY